MVPIVMWPGSADDDDSRFNVNIGLWSQDVLTSLAQESQENLRELRRARESPREPDFTLHCRCTKSHECVKLCNGADVVMLRMAKFHGAKGHVH